MSDTVFLTAINMGLTATYVVLAVMVLRFALRKTPKWLTCALWIPVGLRLICPFSLESVLSLIPSSKPIPTDIGISPTPAIQSGVPFINQSVNPILSQTMTPNPANSINPMQVAIAIGTWIWLIGILAMVIYALITTLRLQRRTKESIRFRNNIYLCDHIDTPFILGIVRPKIFLPSHLSQEIFQSVVAHEQAHLKRLDHLWKPLGFALLSVYWFNPILWVGYILLCKDIEFACDEKVIRTMDSQQVKAYSTALLHLSTGHHMIAACPLAFGEVGVKGRIKAILNYKKPAFWLMVIALIVSATLAICFLTDPPTKKEKDTSHSFAQTKLEEIEVTASGTDLADVTLSITKTDFTSIVPSFTIAWQNESAKQLSLGEEFYIYRLTEGGKTDIRKNPENYVWHLTAFLIDPHKTSYKEYYLYDMDLSAGKYRFETKFSHTDDMGQDDAPTYSAYIEFTVADGAISSIGGADAPADITVNTKNRVLFRVGEFPETDPFMDGSHISQITKGIENDEEIIRIDLTANGTMLFAKATNENVGGIISLWVDGTMFVSATVQMPITNGTLLIHGSLLTDEQLDLLMTLVAQNNANPYFEGVVKENLDNSVLVEVTDQGVSGLSGEVYVSLTSLAQGTWPNLQVGETLRIIYSGEIQETFPPRIFAMYVFNNQNQNPAVEADYMAAMERYNQDPAANRNLGSLQTETTEIILLDDGKIYQSYVSTTADQRYVFVSNKEADLGIADWDFVLVGTATDYSANNIGKLFDDQRASHYR